MFKAFILINVFAYSKYYSELILIRFIFQIQRQPMVGRKLLFDNESLPDTYNESPLPQSPDANEIFAQWDSPMQSPAQDMQDGGGHYDNRYVMRKSKSFKLLCLFNHGKIMF